MTVSVQNTNGKGINIHLPNSLLFSPALLNILIKFGVSHADHKMPELSPETVSKICSVLKSYSKIHGPLELVLVESADGDRVVITI